MTSYQSTKTMPRSTFPTYTTPTITQQGRTGLTFPLFKKIGTCNFREIFQKVSKFQRKKIKIDFIIVVDIKWCKKLQATF